VRDVWKHEELEFAPWLADETNFGLLTAASPACRDTGWNITV
jgi:hypothetical protein